MRKCPECGGEIKKKATRCKHCREDLPVPVQPEGDGCLKVLGIFWLMGMVEYAVRSLGGPGIVSIVAIGTAGFIANKILSDRQQGRLPAGRNTAPDALPPAQQSVALDLAKANCAFCGRPLRDQKIVLCPRCQTPLHADCWDENGQKCTIYGCK